MAEGKPMQKRHLLAPGPTPVPPEALLAMAMPMIHHRAPDFLPILDSAKKGLQWLFQTRNDVLILCSTGTGGMVGAVTNFLSPGDEVLVANGGKFGERWIKICQTYELNVHEIVAEWGYTVKSDQIEAALKKNSKIKAVFMQATDTSTGVYNDVKSLAAVVKKTDALLVVDAVSALGAHDIRTDEWGLDVVVSGSQKGVMLPPGLAFVSVSDKAWKMADVAKTREFYFNFKKERDSLAKNQTNFTSAVSLIIGLNACVKILQDEGLQNVFARHEKLAKATRAGIAALGLKLFPKESPTFALTAVEAPAGVDGQAIYKNLRENYGITGAGGQDKLKGKIFRIAHLGYTDTFDIITAVAGIEMVLKGLGYPVKLGTGVAAAEEILIK
jgi:serine---pyruvate transaminase